MNAPSSLLLLLALPWWLLCLTGIVQIIVESALFLSIRAWVARRSTFFGQVVTCPMCFGMWLGAGASLVVSPSWELLLAFSPAWMQHGFGLIVARVLAMLLDGAAVSWAGFAWHTVRSWFARPVVVPSYAPPQRPVQQRHALPAIFDDDDGEAEQRPDGQPYETPLFPPRPAAGCSVCPPEEAPAAEPTAGPTAKPTAQPAQ